MESLIRRNVKMHDLQSNAAVHNELLNNKAVATRTKRLILAKQLSCMSYAHSNKQTCGTQK